MSYPLKINWKTESFSFLILLASVGFAWFFYMHFPAVVATHWDWHGQANGHMSRLAAAVVLPVVLIGVYLLFLILPYFDPWGREYASFAGAYLAIRNLLLTALMLIDLTVGYANLGDPVSVKFLAPWIFGLLFVAVSYYMPQLKRNWFVGVRTPWTLSSENVWDKTHRFSSRLLLIFGLMLLLLPFLPFVAGLWMFVLGLLGFALGSVVYSYFAYRNESH